MPATPVQDVFLPTLIDPPMTYRLPRILLLGVLILAVSTQAWSQPPPKRPLQHSDYAAWRSIQSPALSPDGTVLVYSVSPQEGNGEFIARDLRTGKEYRFPSGSRGAPAVAQAPPAAGRGRGAVAGSGSNVFSPDGKVVAFPIFPPRAEKGKAKGAPTGNGVGLMTLADGKVTHIERVQSYHFPEDGPSVFAYHRMATAPVVEASKGGAPKTGFPKGRRGQGAAPGAAVTPAPPRQGTELVLRNLADGKERTIADVTEFTLTKDGRWVVYATAGKTEAPGGVFAVGLAREGSPVILRSGPGRYSRLTWDEKQSQLVFFHRLDPTPTTGGPPARPRIRVCHWKPPHTTTSAVLLPSPSSLLTGPLLTALQAGLPGASDLTPAGKPEIQPGYDVTDSGELSFSPDGSRVYFAVAAPPPPPANPVAPGEEKAVVELWHHKDDFIQPMQKIRYTASRTHRAVFHLDDRSCRQLSDETLANVQPASAGDWALALDDRLYRTLVGGAEASAPVDAILINSRTGARKPIAKKEPFPLQFSPGGKYLLSWDGKNWQSVSVPDGKRVNLTAKLGVSFANELFDSPSMPPSYGQAGWTKDDKHVLLHDRFDVWMIAPDGSSAKNLTGGFGRKTSTQLRIVRLDANERSIDPTKPLLLRAENENTRDTGFYRMDFAAAEPKLLIMGSRNYGTPTKARKGDTLLLNVSTFYDYPDLYTRRSGIPRGEACQRRQPAERELRLGQGEPGALQEHRRLAAVGHPHQAGELRARQEVSDDRLHLRAPDRRI